jgi:hypothetical protein
MNVMSTLPDSEQFAGSSAESIRAGRVMDDLTIEGLLGERGRLSYRLPRDVQLAAHELKEAIPHWRTRERGLGGLGSRFIKLSAALRSRLKPSTYVDLNKFLITDLSLSLEAKLIHRDLPDEVWTLYPATVARLLSYIRGSVGDNYGYPNEFFFKDVRFASGLSVPCGTVFVNLRSGLGYRTSVRWLLRHPHLFLRYAGSCLPSGQVFPWFRIHLDSRYMDDFDEPGWDACYMRIAALLRRHSEVLGMVGTSWLYDPQLAYVSPHLSYLRLRPTERGATIVRNGSSDYAISCATAKGCEDRVARLVASTRRKLYEQGKYVPVAYSLLWPREALLGWADAQLTSVE